MSDADLEKISKDKSVLRESIFANIPENIFIFWKDIRSVYLGCNNHYATLLGLASSDEIIGKTDLEIGWLPDGDSAELFRQGDRDTLKGKFIRNQKEWLSIFGRKILVIVSKSPLYDADGQLVGTVGVAMNITAQNERDEAFLDAQRKLAAMTLVGASIAHELRTPLQSLDLGIGNLRDYLPMLFASYQLAEQAGLVTQRLKPSTLELLKGTLDAMEREIRLSSLTINLLLENIKQNPVSHSLPHKTFSAVHCIEQLLQRYPFKPGQQTLIHWQNSHDFQVSGDELLLVHVLFNLTKNALYYLAQARKGEITIWLESGVDYDVLYYKDTATGISPEVLPYIFNQFYSKTAHGAGIGLTYCKMAMEAFGGTIICESVEHEYTLFKLMFPQNNAIMRVC